MRGLDPWLWLAAGALLCAAETVAPGIFLIWLGVAALATGILGFFIPLHLGLLGLFMPLPFEWELLIFCVFAAVAVFIGRKVYGSAATKSDRPFLNQRAEALVGRITILQDAIENGAGRARIDDTIWRVAGPELPAGARVRIVGVEASTLLRVEQA